MGREIRRVPANWKHKRQIALRNRLDSRGPRVVEEFKPMYQHTSYSEAVKEYQIELADWLKGYDKWQEGIYWNSYDNTETPIADAFKKWMESIDEERKKYSSGGDFREEEYKKYESGVCNWEDIAGEPPRYPNPDDYMPTGEWYQLYETVSEGCPLSPPFRTKEQLAKWLTENKDFWDNQWTKEQAEAMLDIGYSPSMVVSGGKVFNSQEALTMDKSTK